ncbi:MAG: efflux RND transporter periplasmic adaptor subunit, partial [Bacteroidota bacterium]
MSRILFFSLLLFALSACKENLDDVQQAAAGRQDVTAVRVVTVETTTNPIPIFTLGKVSSSTETKLSFKIGGVIASMTADEGDYVRKGQTIARLRKDEIDAQVLKAQRALTKAERDLERIKAMYADSAATLENVQDLTTLVEVSRADLDIATFNQQYANIVSPVSGRVLRRLAEPNELIGPGQPIFLVASSQKNNQVVRVGLSDKDINQIAIGTPADLQFDAYPGDTIPGRVTQIDENADPMTGTFGVEIAVNAGDRRLRNGYLGRVTLLPKIAKPYYKIPIDAIVEGGDGNIVIFKPIQGDTIAQELITRPFHINSSFA